MSFQQIVSRAQTRNHYGRVLAEKRALRKVTRELLDCYWGAGDRDPPPEFITRAARLSGWKFKERK